MHPSDTLSSRDSPTPQPRVCLDLCIEKPNAPTWSQFDIDVPYHRLKDNKGALVFYVRNLSDKVHIRLEKDHNILKVKEILKKFFCNFNSTFVSAHYFGTSEV